MVSKSVVFECEYDLQMKAVAVLVQKASALHSTVYVTRDGRRANAKSLLGVMSLGIENGVEVEISAEGGDEQEAVDVLAGFLQNPKV